jgi:hypothetical protein
MIIHTVTLCIASYAAQSAVQHMNCHCGDLQGGGRPI